LQRWPALLQCLLGLQCQSRPSAAHIHENGLQSGIWRVCHHPLTVSGPKPAFKWSKHRRPPKCGEQSEPNRSGPARRHSPDATLPQTLICAQSADHTPPGVPLLSESWQQAGRVAGRIVERKLLEIRIGLQVHVDPLCLAKQLAEVLLLRRTATNEKPRRRWGQGGAFNGRFA
jgi:hypothetical protein